MTIPHALSLYNGQFIPYQPTFARRRRGDRCPADSRNRPVTDSPVYQIVQLNFLKDVFVP